MHIIQMAQEQHAFTLGMPFLGVLGKFDRNRKGLNKGVCSRTLQVQCCTRWAIEQVYYIRKPGYEMQTSKCISLQGMHYGKSVLTS